ncbi:sensor of ECF-type sigma factor [Flavobacterium sp.]|uniref:sensor of ECF-type sigma factor n=1 Tax=Flavobacterium sp. TaxID=239 RepID=UPI00286E789A|nr:sensor of ECF-type sigma factor [Flavobacterium sp.]
MKKINIFLFAIILFVLNTNAQPNQEKKEKIKALKVAFITNELSLTSDESIKFWPVFNVFEAKQQEIRGTKTKSIINRMSDEDLEKMSDKEAINLMNQLENTEEELFQNRKKLITNLKGILSPIKLLKLKRAEDNFSKKLLQQYRNKD